MKIEEFEKIMQREDREEKQEDLEKIWDSKSEWFFKRTEKKQENFSNRLVFKIIKEKKLLNENSKVLDIGCGTGRHLLEFSKFTSYVTGTDISSKMLDYAKEKLKNVSEAKFVHGNWMENFTKEKEFDLVFASMTPAITTIEHIKRMCLISKKYCLMERFVYDRDPIREEIEGMLGRKLNKLHSNQKEYTYGVWNIVWNLGYFPEIYYDKYFYEAEKTITDYMEQIICTDEEKNKIIEPEMLTLIASVSSRINREINIAIDRKGNVTEISIGDSSSVQLPFLNVQEKRLSGTRVIHTHPSGSSNLSNIDISALTKLKLDCIVAIGINEDSITGMSIGFCSVDGNDLSHEIVGPLSVEQIVNYDFLSKIEEIESFLKKREIIENDDEYAILVGLDDNESLDELAELARACNVKVVAKFFQKKTKIDSCYFIGPGKAQELAVFKQLKKANLIIFDEELSGLQVRNLEELTSCKVIDRTVLILEIFATRARTREAKIQVELAQLK